MLPQFNVHRHPYDKISSIQDLCSFDTPLITVKIVSNMTKYQILGTFTGKIKLITRDIESAILKESQKKIHIKKNIIENDDVANKIHHGGDMRVVHHYSLKNYNYLKNKFPEIADRFIPGSFGENIVTEELTEDDLNIGDIYSLGSAIVQLTVSRRPCATINLAYQDNRILKEVTRTGHTGWFYRVLQEGTVGPGDYLTLLESPFPNLPVSKLFEQGYGEDCFCDIEFLRRCMDTGLMDKGWKTKIEEAFKNLS